MGVLESYKVLRSRRDSLLTRQAVLQESLTKSQEKMERVLNEQRLLEGSLQALKDVKPILSAHSIDQCEKLANAALFSIFHTNAKVTYSAEDGRFMVNEGEFETDLTEGNGGAFVAVISLVFNLFLLMKTKKRLFLVFDEHFTQISKEYFDGFFQFLHQLCKDLHLDVMLITHDQRVELEMCDHLYVMEDGVMRKVK